MSLIIALSSDPPTHPLKNVPPPAFHLMPTAATASVCCSAARSRTSPHATPAATGSTPPSEAPRVSTPVGGGEGGREEREGVEKGFRSPLPAAPLAAHPLLILPTTYLWVEQLVHLGGEKGREGGREGEGRVSTRGLTATQACLSLPGRALGCRCPTYLAVRDCIILGVVDVHASPSFLPSLLSLLVVPLSSSRPTPSSARGMAIVPV